MKINRKVKTEADADAITVIYGHGFNPGTPRARAVDELKERLEKEANSRILADAFPAGQLGYAREIFERVQMGSREAGHCGVTPSVLFLYFLLSFIDS